jgi:mRNA interferase MazF
MAADPLAVLRRGDIVRARFDPVEGSEQGGIRPAVVLSPARFNRGSNIIVLAAITSQKLDRVYPFEALLEAGDGVPRESKVLLSQIRGVAKTRILSYYGHVSDNTMLAVDAALAIAVGLER